MSESGIIQTVVSVAWRLFATKASEALNTGDVADEKIRQLLLSEFQKIHEHLDALRRKELLAAVAFLETGFELVGKDDGVAKDEFKKARDAAQMAFGVVQAADDKLLATKVLITASIHEFHDRPETQKTLCLKYVERLNALPEVCKACVHYFDSKSTSLLNRTSKTERQNLIRTVADINACAYDLLSGSDSRESLLACWPPIKLQTRQIHAIHDLALFRRNQTKARLAKTLGTVATIVDAVSCSGKVFATVGQSCNYHTVVCIDIASGQVRHLIGHSQVVLALATKDGLVFSGSYDKTVMVWDSHSLACLHVIKESDGAVRSLCTSDAELFIASTDGCVRSYQIQNYEPRNTYQCGSPISNVACSRRKFLFVATAQQKIQIWDMDKCVRLQELDCCNNLSRLIISDNLLFCLSNGPLHLLSLGSLQFDKQAMDVMTTKAALNGTGRLLLSGGQQLSMWDIKSRKCTWKDDVYFGQERVPLIDFLWFHNGFLFGFCRTKDNGIVLMKW